MERCKISVIMPSLNVENYIEECLQSVCAQTLEEMEIICVDAGSTDGTVSIIKKYASKDFRIRLIHSNKKSYGYQVNIGIQRACGQYIAILETDDYIDADMYASLYEIAESTGCDYVKANFRGYQTTVEGDRLYWDYYVFTEDKNNYDHVLDVAEHMGIIRRDQCVWSGIYRRNFLIENKIKCNESSGAAYQDIGFLQQIFWHANKAYYLNKPFYNYCTDREDSSSNRGDGLRFAYQEYQYLLSDKLFQNIDTSRVSSIYERMADVFWECFTKILKQDREKENADIIRWFLEILLTKEKQGIIHRDYLEHIITDGIIWVQTLKKQWYSEQEWRNCLLEKLEDTQAIIFGAGVIGKSVYRELDRARISVGAFCDNNNSLWGQKIGSKLIYSLKDTMRLFPQATYVVANRRYYGDMEKQLLEMGIPPTRIVIWK